MTNWLKLLVPVGGGVINENLINLYFEIELMILFQICYKMTFINYRISGYFRVG